MKVYLVTIKIKNNIYDITHIGDNMKKIRETLKGSKEEPIKILSIKKQKHINDTQLLEL